MKADLFVLQICDFLDDGDGFYRLHEPSRQLSRLPGVAVVDCHFYHRLLPSLVGMADVLILPFIHNWDFFPEIEERRKAGRITVFEANDYFYDVQPWNAVGPQWQDRAIQDEYAHYMSAADAVQTSTQELARRWADFAQRVVVFTNHLAEIPPLAAPPPRPVTVGWGGSPGHFADWFAIAPTLEKWLQVHPEVHLAVMTNEFAKPFIQLAPERYHFTPFGTLSEYLRFLPSLDIGLAPLLPSEYNRCRSDVKFLEYASHGVAGIYADLEPYRDTVVPGETGLLYKTEHDLARGLDRLLTNAELRQRIREQAYAHVARERRIADHIGERLSFYRRLLPKPPQGSDIPEEALEVAARDGNYLQLRPQQPEQEFLKAIQAPASREATYSLIRLIDQCPEYVAALQQLGRLFNDLHEYRSALPYLERALALNSKSAATLCEIGRAHFGQGDVDGAQKDLHRALEINPFYTPGWQYLLRLYGLRKSAEGPRSAGRAHQLHPRNYSLALAGAKTYPNEEGVKVLLRLLNDYLPSLTASEKPVAAVAFGQAIQEVAGPLLATAVVLPLLRRAVEIFPESARLADLFARALHMAGRYRESREQFARALEIQRSAVTYKSEFPQEGGAYHYWQFAEHIRRWVEEA